MTPLEFPHQLSEWSDTAILIGITVVAGVAARWLVGVLIKRGVQSSLRSRPGDLFGRGRRNERHEQRTRTLAALLGSIASCVIAFVVVTTVLGLIGIPLTPFLASAGIGGVALGFGAQSLVKDFLSGVFMILEDQFGVGDTIVVGTVSGTVQGVGLRVTRVLDADGRVWYLRNGDLSTVGNLSQADAVVHVDIPVHWSADPQEVTRVLSDAVAGVAGVHGTAIVRGLPGSADTQNALRRDVGSRDADHADARTPDAGAAEVLGIDAIAGNSQQFRIEARTSAEDRAETARQLRARALTALHDAGVQGPF